MKLKLIYQEPPSGNPSIVITSRISLTGVIRLLNRIDGVNKNSQLISGRIDEMADKPVSFYFMNARFNIKRIFSDVLIEAETNDCEVARRFREALEMLDVKIIDFMF